MRRKRFRVVIDCEGEAFAQYPQKIARLLNELAVNVECHGRLLDEVRLYDENGNRVGVATFGPEIVNPAEDIG